MLTVKEISKTRGLMSICSQHMNFLGQTAESLSQGSFYSKSEQKLLTQLTSDVFGFILADQLMSVIIIGQFMGKKKNIKKLADSKRIISTQDQRIKESKPLEQENQQKMIEQDKCVQAVNSYRQVKGKKKITKKSAAVKRIISTQDKREYACIYTEKKARPKSKKTNKKRQNKIALQIYQLSRVLATLGKTVCTHASTQKSKRIEQLFQSDEQICELNKEVKRKITSLPLYLLRQIELQTQIPQNQTYIPNDCFVYAPRNIQKKVTKKKPRCEPKTELKWRDQQCKLFMWTLIYYLQLRQLTLQQLGQADWDYFSKIFPNKQPILFEFQAKKLTTLPNKKWTSQEEEIFTTLVQNKGGKNYWCQLSLELFVNSQRQNYRTPNQCRDRWASHLSPSNSKDEWSPREDQILIRKVYKKGKKWINISKILNGRSSLALIDRYKCLIMNEKKLHPEPKKEEELIEIMIERYESHFAQPDPINKRNTECCYDKRLKLVQMIENQGKSLKFSANFLGITRITAQLIMKTWKDVGKVFQSVVDRRKRKSREYRQKSQARLREKKRLKKEAEKQRGATKTLQKPAGQLKMEENEPEDIQQMRIEKQQSIKKEDNEQIGVNKALQKPAGQLKMEENEPEDIQQLRIENLPQEPVAPNLFYPTCPIFPPTMYIMPQAFYYGHMGL